ncbi:MAG: YjgP/YjgQ family permease, partial [bacterium]|nr:YjgP/YjgQ family permease [bacterium]
TVVGFGRMSADSEILAIKASGQNLFYLITPVISAAILLSVSLIFFHNLILPEANHRSANLMSDISRKKPAALIEPNILIKDFENYSMIVNKVKNRTGELNDITIFSDVPGEEPSTTIADSGTIQLTKDEKYLQLVLFNGETHHRSKENPREYYLVKFKKHMIFMPNVDSRLQRTERHYRGDREKSAQMLLKDIKGFKGSKNSALQSYNKTLLATGDRGLTFDSLAHDSSLAPSLLNLDTISTFAQWRQSLQAYQPTAVRHLQKHQRHVNRTIQQIHRQDRKISQYFVEVHKKFSVSVACIIFVLIGVPLGIMAKRGGIAVGASYSIFFFVMYWAFLIGGENLADRLIVPPGLAMWSCNIVIGIFGIFLILKMVRGSTFINYEPFLKLWHRITS